MKTLYLLPFTYFLNTRLRGGSLAFHVIFEWLAAAVLAITIGTTNPAGALLLALGSYVAFISLYEIGYLVNDMFAAKREDDGRKRGPQGAPLHWVLSWFLSRLFAFLAITIIMDQLVSVEWWLFFFALTLVFAMHNLLEDREMKAATFQWLALLRFMAPVLFVVQDSQVPGVGLAASVAYVAFRTYGYLDSKGLLQMPGRQRSEFRIFFFFMPLVGVVVLWPYESALGFIILSCYFAVVAFFGTLVRLVSRRESA